MVNKEQRGELRRFYDSTMRHASFSTEKLLFVGIAVNDALDYINRLEQITTELLSQVEWYANQDLYKQTNNGTWYTGVGKPHELIARAKKVLGGE